MIAIIRKFLKDESALTTVEYAVAGALISVTVLGAFTTLGGSVGATLAIVDALLPG